MAARDVDERVAFYAGKLMNDLAFSAPEMVSTHVQRRMEQLADDLTNEEED